MRSLIMPLTVGTLLWIALLQIGISGGDAITIAGVMAAWSWLFGRITAAVANFFRAGDHHCLGVALVGVCAAGLGGFGSALILGWFAEGSPQAALLMPQVPLLAVGICVLAFGLRIMVNVAFDKTKAGTGK